MRSLGRRLLAGCSPNGTSLQRSPLEWPRMLLRLTKTSITLACEFGVEACVEDRPCVVERVGDVSHLFARLHVVAIVRG